MAPCLLTEYFYRERERERESEREREIDKQKEYMEFNQSCKSTL